MPLLRTWSSGYLYKGIRSYPVITVLQNGTRLTVAADEAYLRESIRQPTVKIVDDFQTVMPNFPELKDEDVEALVKFIEGIK